MANKLDAAIGQQINLALFPARVGTKVARAKAAKRYEHSTKKNSSTVPIADNAYARTMRFHEALHQIFTPAALDELPVTQAVEDARLHLTCSKSEGQVRRDEIYSSLLELRNTNKMTADTAAATLVRSAAVLRRGCNERERKLWLKAAAAYAQDFIPLEKDGPDTRMVDFTRRVKHALEALERKDFNKACKSLTQYFTDKPPDKGSGNDDSGFSLWASHFFKWDESVEELKLQLMKADLTTDALDLMQERTRQALQEYIEQHSPYVPKMNVHEIYNIASQKTYNGPTEKTAFSGTRIRAKKLATIVGPTQPRIFIRKIRHSSGGTVLIDASGSMSLDDSVIISVAEALPFGTIAYYSAPSDACHEGGYGDLVIYADKGKRYNPLQGVNKEKLPLHHDGNLIDLMALQWLLKQKGPRYLVSDGGWTGSVELMTASQDIAENATARKLIEWHRTVRSLLKRLDINLAGVNQ